MKAIPTHFSCKWDMWQWLTCFLGMLKGGTILETKPSNQFHILATWSFNNFHKERIDHFILLNGALKSLNGV